MLPESVLFIEDPEEWETEALSLVSRLIADGKRPWFEIRWPAPSNLDANAAREWLLRQEEAFDAVEYVDGVFVTLPPYSELMGR